MNSKHWEQFERLVAAIHRALDPTAKVTWNESIEGRQFDVTIRFKKGMYSYLTVIECKDYATAVSVEKVEAFITKAHDARANQAVMASSTGFQSGAHSVASRHNVTLMQLTDSPDIQPLFGAKWGESVNAIHVKRIELRYTDGEAKTLPESAGALTYYVSRITVRDGRSESSLDDLVGKAAQLPSDSPIDCYVEKTIPLPGDSILLTPDDGEYPSKRISSIVVTVGNTMARTLSGPTLFDFSLMLPDVEVANLSSGEKRVVSRHGLALGTAERFEKGSFYEQPQNEYYYYCEEINAEVATILLVESFQHGELVQAELKVQLKYANHYSQVTDSLVIARLTRRLARLKGRQSGSK
jgi:hypothetical protein